MVESAQNFDQILRIRRHQPTRLEGFVDAALAFSVTLLVISIGHVPTTVGEMLQALRGLPTFGFCFLLIARIWTAHRYWSRHYDIEDTTSVHLSLLLVFLVLIYVYPLRMLFTLAVDSISGGAMVDQRVIVHNVDELRAAYTVFGAALASIAFVFVLLFRHALKCGEVIGLDPAERIITKLRILGWSSTGAIALLSILVAYSLPFDGGTALGYSLPGCIYFLLFFPPRFLRWYGMRRISTLSASTSSP
jgi:uncharacterized membrane protein